MPCPPSKQFCESKILKGDRITWNSWDDLHNNIPEAIPIQENNPTVGIAGGNQRSATLNGWSQKSHGVGRNVLELQFSLIRILNHGPLGWQWQWGLKSWMISSATYQNGLGIVLPLVRNAGDCGRRWDKYSKCLIHYTLVEPSRVMRFPLHTLWIVYVLSAEMIWSIEVDWRDGECLSLLYFCLKYSTVGSQGNCAVHEMNRSLSDHTKEGPWLPRLKLGLLRSGWLMWLTAVALAWSCVI